MFFLGLSAHRQLGDRRDSSRLRLGTGTPTRTFSVWDVFQWLTRQNVLIFTSLKEKKMCICREQTFFALILIWKWPVDNKKYWTQRLKEFKENICLKCINFRISRHYIFQTMNVFQKGTYLKRKLQEFSEFIHHDAWYLIDRKTKRWQKTNRR